jgi:UDP-glucose:(heptosyl)LPS alpha-1,3-glucosyltransferase
LSQKQITFVRRNWSPTGGAENYLLRLVSGLSRNEWSSTLLCESWNGEATPFTDVIRMKTSGPRWNRPAQFADAVNRHLSNHPTDCAFSMERGIKAHLYRAGDGVHREWLYQRSRGRPLRAWLRNHLNPKNRCLLDLERVTFHPENTGRVIANSEMVRDDILRHFDYPQERISLIPNGVDYATFSGGDRFTGRQAMGWGHHQLVCLLVGAGAERKGHRFAVEAVARAGSRFELAIIDQPPPCSMPDLYAAADIFLLPTLYDPFANVTLEAMAAGLPVITTRQNGAQMVIDSGKNGFLIHQLENISELSAYLMALSDAELRKNVGDAARKTAQKMSAEAHQKQTLEIILQATKEGCR